MSDYDDESRPDGMQPDTGDGSECFTCGAPCGFTGGSLCDPRCPDCPPESREAS